jgi:hypothetical protein
MRRRPGHSLPSGDLPYGAPTKYCAAGERQGFGFTAANGGWAVRGYGLNSSTKPKTFTGVWFQLTVCRVAMIFQAGIPPHVCAVACKRPTQLCPQMTQINADEKNLR